jgi:hypothetical protein
LCRLPLIEHAFRTELPRGHHLRLYRCRLSISDDGDTGLFVLYVRWIITSTGVSIFFRGTSEIFSTIDNFTFKNKFFFGSYRDAVGGTVFLSTPQATAVLLPFLI